MGGQRCFSGVTYRFADSFSGLELKFFPFLEVLMANFNGKVQAVKLPKKAKDRIFKR